MNKTLRNVKILYKLLLWMCSEKLNKIYIFKDGYINKTISVVVAAALLIGAIVLKLFFTFYQFLINKYLEYTLKDNYEGMLCGMDTLLMMSIDQVTINDLYFVKSNKLGDEFAKEVTTHLQEKLKQEGYKKLMTSTHKFMGYLYNQRCNLNIEEIIKVVKYEENELTHERLLEVLENCTNTPMPDNNKFNFDVFIIATPIQETYVILLRMDHNLVDGVTMYNLSTNLLCKKSEKKNEYAEFLNKIKDISNVTPTYTKKPVTKIQYNSFYTPKQESNTKMLMFADPTQKYFKAIKSIMKKYQVRFQDVVESALSFSISQSFPTNDDCIVTLSPRQVNISRMVNCYKNQELYQYGNDFAVYYHRIPNGNKLNNINRLQAVHRELYEIHEALDFWIINAVMLLFATFPLSLTKLFLGQQGNPLVLTSFPGGSKLKLFNGDSVEDKMFYCPKNPGCGIVQCLYTYDDRLQFVVTTNKTNMDQMNGFIDNFLNYLDELLDAV